MIEINKVQTGDWIKSYTGQVYKIVDKTENSIICKRFFSKTDRWGKNEIFEQNIFSNFEDSGQ